jgi:hypothetical protein
MHGVAKTVASIESRLFLLNVRCYVPLKIELNGS